MHFRFHSVFRSLTKVRTIFSSSFLLPHFLLHFRTIFFCARCLEKKWNDATKSVCDSSQMTRSEKRESHLCSHWNPKIVAGLPTSSIPFSSVPFDVCVLPHSRTFLDDVFMVDWYKCIVFSAILTSDGEPFICCFLNSFYATACAHHII